MKYMYAGKDLQQHQCSKSYLVFENIPNRTFVMPQCNLLLFSGIHGHVLLINLSLLDLIPFHSFSFKGK